MPNLEKGKKEKSDLAEEGPGGAMALPGGEAGEANTCNLNENVVLAAIASLRSKLHTIKTDICDR